jgi:hypothetical protein
MSVERARAEQVRAEQVRSVALALLEQAGCSYYYAGPTPALELPAITTTLPTYAASFHFSKCDSLQPPVPLNLSCCFRSTQNNFSSPTSEEMAPELDLPCADEICCSNTLIS